MMKSAISALMILLTMFGYSQNPANDNCDNAIELLPGQYCINQVDGTTVGATQSQAACSGTADDDVWYIFTATATNMVLHVQASGSSGFLVNPVLQVFSGSCTSLNSIACVNASSSTSSSASETANLTTLTVGQTYYARVYSAGNLTTQRGTFTICLTQPPANDDCANAQTLTPQALGATCTPAQATAGTTHGATTGSQADCRNFLGRDVWYSFDAISTVHEVTVTSAAVNGINNPAIQVYRGSCTSLTSIVCANDSSNSSPETAKLSGLTIGEKIWIRVHNASSSFASAGAFSICIATLQVPANNLCENAQVLTPVADTQCVAPTVGSTRFATNDRSTCQSGTYRDVWYSFVATATNHTVDIQQTQPGSKISFGFELLSGNCGSPTSLDCYPSNWYYNAPVSNLSIGQTYYLRVWANTSNGADFTICLRGSNSPNDTCTNAITIPINPNTNCSQFVIGTNAEASAGLPNCKGEMTADVWYKFTATHHTHDIRLDEVSNFDGSISSAYYWDFEVLQGTCSNLLPVYKKADCNIYIEDNIRLSSLQPGTTYWVRVYRTVTNLSPSTGKFKLCITTPAPPPPNDECAGAIALPVSQAAQPRQWTTGTNAQAAHGNNTGCGMPAYADVWYKFTATASRHSITVNPAETNMLRNVAFEVMSGTCSSLQSLQCVNNNNLEVESETTTLNGLTPGNTYYVRVFSTMFEVERSNKNRYGIFSIAVATPPLPPATHDTCAAAINLIPSATCNPTIGALSGMGAEAGQTDCYGTVSSNIDVWYKFTATATAHLVQLAPENAQSAIDLAYQILDGSCGTFTVVQCVNNSNNVTDAESAVIAKLIPGKQYFIRVYKGFTQATANQRFTICITNPSNTLPPNDECDGAIPVAVNTGAACTQQTIGSNMHASESVYSYSTAHDVWYKFVATDTAHTIRIAPAGSQPINTLSYALYGGSCNSLSQLAIVKNFYRNSDEISIGEVKRMGGLTIGATYFIRVFGDNQYNNSQHQGSFSICITTPAPPANDNCANATTVPVNAGTTCAQQVSGSTQGATMGFAPLYGVSDFEWATDMWYNFTAISTRHFVHVSTANASASSGYVRAMLYNSDCANLQPIEVFPDSLLYLTNLAPGTRYKLRLFTPGEEYQPPTQQGLAFTVCITTPPAPPANDEPAQAIAITPNAGATCSTATQGSTYAATTTAITTSGYGEHGGANVFYKFTATSVTHLLELKPSGTRPIKSWVVDVYDPANLQSLTTTGYYDSTILITNAIIGKEYHILVSTEGSATEMGDFNICLSTFAPPANDDCANATQLTPGNCATPVAGNNSLATSSGVKAGTGPCSGQTPDNDVWYSFVATGPQHTIYVTPGSTLPMLKNPLIEVWQTTSCPTGSSTYIGCYNNINNNSGKDSAELTNLVSGRRYLVRVTNLYNSFSERGSFNICVSTSPVSIEACNSAIVLTPSTSNTPILQAGITTTADTIDVGTYDCMLNGVTMAKTNFRWYRFNITDVRNVLKIMPADHNNHNLAWNVMKGTCSVWSSQQLLCNSKDSLMAGLGQVGEQIMVKVYSLTGKAEAFNIGVYTPTLTNDDCDNATELPVHTTTDGPMLLAMPQVATQSIPACAGTAAATDVWFKVKGNGSDIMIITDPGINPANRSIGSHYNHTLQYFTGTCGSLVSQYCGHQSNDNLMLIPQTVSDQWYYIRLYGTDAVFIKAYAQPQRQQSPQLEQGCQYTNIATNGGFEATEECPTMFNTNVTPGNSLAPNGWFFVGNGTSDFFHSCGASDDERSSSYGGINGSGNPTEVVNNQCFGYAEPRSGKGMVGGYSLAGGFSDYREHIGLKLPQPLEPGKRYLISFFVRLNQGAQVAHNKIGVAFGHSTALSGAIPQLVSPEAQYFTNKTGWDNVSFLYTPDQAYSHMAIGNFNYNSKTQTIPIANHWFMPKTWQCNSGSESSVYLYYDDITIAEVNEAAVTNGCNAALPLTLTQFEAFKINNDVQLRWQTVYEQNTSHFVVEHSTDGIHFTPVARVSAAGNSGSTVRAYQHLHRQPAQGTNYYRLHMVDKDGTATYSNVRIVIFDADIAPNITVYPNPAHNTALVSGLQPGGIIRIISSAGTVLLQVSTNSATQSLTLNNLAAGLYLIECSFKNQIKHARLIKM